MVQAHGKKTVFHFSSMEIHKANPQPLLSYVSLSSISKHPERIADVL
uniref:Uncharacterized protein n=1 Tax=Anguilla anguilla TaxID=7936 RepID=A0A0E9PQR3_ANGAN